MKKMPSAMSLIKVLALVAVLVISFSCAGPKIQVPEPEPYEGPVDLEVLKDFKVLHGVTSIRSEVRVKVRRGKKKLGSLKGALLYHEPDYIRLRVYSPLGSDGVDIVHVNGLLQAYVPSNGVIYEGHTPITKEGLRYYMEEHEKKYTLVALKPEAWGTSIYAQYEYDRTTLLNKRVTVYEDGEQFAKMYFKDFLGAVPLRAKFELFGGYAMYIDLINPEVDVDIPPEYFEQMSHEGLQVLPLERIMNEGR
jgi:outer membrane lipoprotein-sorting protein